MVWLYYILSRCATLLLFIWFDIRFEGGENIPKKGGYLIACNHRTYLDPVLLTWKVRSHICYFAKTELFDHPFFGVITRIAECIRIERGTGDTTALDKAGELLKKGKVIGIFPEGTRSKDGKLQRAKSGMAVIAKMTGADILPCCILFEGPLHFRSKITMRFGQIIKNSDLGFVGISARETVVASKYIMSKIAALMGDALREDSHSNG